LTIPLVDLRVSILGVQASFDPLQLEALQERQFAPETLIDEFVIAMPDLVIWQGSDPGGNLLSITNGGRATIGGILGCSRCRRMLAGPRLAA
jgi:hypothetical protein